MKQVTIEDKTFGIYIQDNDIQQAIQTIANEMNVLYADKKPIFISVLNGAFMFTVDLLKKIEVPCELSFIKLSSYSGTTSTGTVKEIVGLQDQIATAFGGFNLIKFKKNKEFDVKKINIKKEITNKLNKNLFLLYTGIDRRANDIAKTYVKTLTNKNYQNLNFIMNSVDKALIYLKNDKLDDFGYLLHESWVYKKQLSKKITNFKINYLYDKAIKSGAVGGKLLGAGGGGFMLLYVPNLKHDIFRKFFRNEVFVPFKFENMGSQIIFKA